MPDIATAFMDDVNFRGPPLTMRPTVQDGISLPCLQTPHPVSSIPCASAQMISIWGHSGNIGIYCFIWEHLNNVNQVLQCVKKAREPFQVGKWIFASWKLWLSATTALMKDIIQRIRRFRRFWLAGLKYSNWGSRIPRCMQHHTNLGQRLCKKMKPLMLLTKKNIDFVWGPEQQASMEDLKQQLSQPLSLANRLSFWLMYHFGHLLRGEFSWGSKSYSAMGVIAVV